MSLYHSSPQSATTSGVSAAMCGWKVGPAVGCVSIAWRSVMAASSLSCWFLSCSEAAIAAMSPGVRSPESAGRPDEQRLVELAQRLEDRALGLVGLARLGAELLSAAATIAPTFDASFAIAPPAGAPARGSASRRWSPWRA